MNGLRVLLSFALLFSGLASANGIGPARRHPHHDAKNAIEQNALATASLSGPRSPTGGYYPLLIQQPDFNELGLPLRTFRVDSALWSEIKQAIKKQFGEEFYNQFKVNGYGYLRPDDHIVTVRDLYAKQTADKLLEIFLSRFNAYHALGPDSRGYMGNIDEAHDYIVEHEKLHLRVRAEKDLMAELLSQAPTGSGVGYFIDEFQNHFGRFHHAELPETVSDEEKRRTAVEEMVVVSLQRHSRFGDLSAKPVLPFALRTFGKTVDDAATKIFHRMNSYENQLNEDPYLSDTLKNGVRQIMEHPIFSGLTPQLDFPEYATVRIVFINPKEKFPHRKKWIQLEERAASPRTYRQVIRWCAGSASTLDIHAGEFDEFAHAIAVFLEKFPGKVRGAKRMEWLAALRENRSYWPPVNWAPTTEQVESSEEMPVDEIIVQTLESNVEEPFLGVIISFLKHPLMRGLPFDVEINLRKVPWVDVCLMLRYASRPNSKRNYWFKWNFSSMKRGYDFEVRSSAGWRYWISGAAIKDHEVFEERIQKYLTALHSKKRTIGGRNLIPSPGWIEKRFPELRAAA